MRESKNDQPLLTRSLETESEESTKAPLICILVSWVLNSYGTKICYAGQTKLCLQNNFVAEDNSNYMKDNYDGKLLRWLNKIIKYTLLLSKDSFTMAKTKFIRNYIIILMNFSVRLIQIYILCQVSFPLTNAASEQSSSAFWLALLASGDTCWLASDFPLQSPWSFVNWRTTSS